MGLWQDLIVRYYQTHKRSTLIVHECPLWSNHKLGRRLSTEGIGIVLDHLIASGRAEWLYNDDDTTTTNNRTAVRIFWKTPKEVATEVYQWAVQTGTVGGICTIYELHAGEEIRGTALEQIDEELLRRALAILQEQGKCTIFQGETSSEDGIKFYWDIY